MSDFELVDVPPEEPEQQLEPWQVYMTDPVVFEAVNALALKDEISLPFAAKHLAKTLAPAPHNIAAQDARYLLAPEAAQADEDAWRRELDPEWAKSIAMFDLSAHTEAQLDGPDTSQGLAYSDGLQNRAGVSIEAPGPAEGDFFVDTQTGTREPVPPASWELSGGALLNVIWVLGGDESGPWLTAEQHGEELAKKIAELASLLRAADLVPFEPVRVLIGRLATTLVSFDPDHPVLWQIRLTVPGAPARGRAFRLLAEVGSPAETEEYREGIEFTQASCRKWMWIAYPQLTTGVGWDLHPHVGVQMNGITLISGSSFLMRSGSSASTWQQVLDIFSGGGD